MNTGILVAAGFIGLYFLVFFIWGTLSKNNGVVDFGWGLGFVFGAAATAVYTGQADGVTILLIGLVALWGLRLSYHIFLRNHGKPEDFRYANWRREWGKWVVPRAFLQVYLLQAVMMLIVGYGVFYANTVTGKQLNLWVAMGLIVWLIGYYFEVVGDSQLATFKKDKANKGKIIQTGPLAVHAAPELFWRGDYVVGHLYSGLGQHG